MTNPAPLPPMTPAAANAAQLHELFTSYVDAGFTEAQALSIVNNVLTASISTQMQLAAHYNGGLL